MANNPPGGEVDNHVMTNMNISCGESKDASEIVNNLRIRRVTYLQTKKLPPFTVQFASD